jgi:DNA-binding LacI/PurR family transcriptional regulator
MATLKDVARECGMSIPTVSQVFGKRTMRFSEKTRKLVFDTAKRIGYRRHTGATNLASGKTNNIFILLPDTSSLATPRMSGFLGLTEAAAARNQQLSLACLRGGSIMNEPFMRRILLERFCDGIIFNSIHSEREADAIEGALRREGLPMIWMNMNRPLNTVCPDEGASAKLLAKRLHNFGHRHIMYFGVSSDNMHFSTIQRPEFLKREFLALGGRSVRRIDRWGSKGDFMEQAASFLSNPGDVTAMVFYSEAYLMRLSALSTSLGLQFPGNWQLAVFDAPADYSGGSVRLRLEAAPPDFGRINALAVEMLLKRIDSDGGDIPSVLVPPLHCKGETLWKAGH